MRERHHRSNRKHPRLCTCTSCQSRRIQVSAPKLKKKRKPKSQRGKAGNKKVFGSAIADAMDILGFVSEVDGDTESKK